MAQPSSAVSLLHVAQPPSAVSLLHVAQPPSAVIDRRSMNSVHESCRPPARECIEATRAQTQAGCAAQAEPRITQPPTQATPADENEKEVRVGEGACGSVRE